MRIPVTGGPIETLTDQGGFTGLVDASGQWLYHGRRGEPGLWRKSLSSPGRSELWLPDFPIGFGFNWALVDGGFAVLDHQAQMVSELAIWHLSGQVTSRMAFEEELFGLSDLAISGDGRQIWLAVIDHSDSDLWLATPKKLTTPGKHP